MKLPAGSLLSAFLMVASASTCNAFTLLSTTALARQPKSTATTLLFLSDTPKDDVATESVFVPSKPADDNNDDDEEEEDVLEKVELLGKGAAKVSHNQQIVHGTMLRQQYYGLGY